MRVLVTAGPTRAYLDNVRFLSNFSTGLLGFEICKSLAARGVELYIVAGQTAQPFEKLRAKKLVKVETNEQMRQAVLSICKKYQPQYGIFSAAVLDFVPEKPRKGKVSSRKKWVLKLVPAPKIIDEVTDKFPNIKKIGFKLEWNKNPSSKLRRFAEKNIREKSLEILILNFLLDVGSKKHKAYIFQKDGTRKTVYTKKQIAHAITKRILKPSNE